MNSEIRLLLGIKCGLPGGMCSDVPPGALVCGMADIQRQPAAGDLVPRDDYLFGRIWLASLMIAGMTATLAAGSCPPGRGRGRGRRSMNTISRSWLRPISPSPVCSATRIAPLT